jgi:hypothetical protein
MVDSENFKITQSVAQAQLVVGLKFISVAGPTDALEVLTAVRIPWGSFKAARRSW